MKALNGGFLVWKADIVDFSESEPVLEENKDNTLLFTLNKNWDALQDKFQIQGNLLNHANDRLWVVIRSLKESGYTIKKSDIIKLGRMKFWVKEYRTKSESFSTDTEERGEFSEIRQVLPVPPEE
jgi:hypothetical protein